MEHQPDSVTPTGFTSALENKVFCVRKNDPRTCSLCVGSELEPRAWKQLGRFLCKNTHVMHVCLYACHLKEDSMAALCAGLARNAYINEFEISDCPLKDADVRSLAPFLRENPSLHTINIEGCLRRSQGAQGAVELLSEALAHRGTCVGSIENLSLDDNFVGVHHMFDALIAALNKNRELRRFSLVGNAIGKSGCQSLARLLKNPASQLKSLVLRHNCIDDEGAAVLAAALTRNTTLSNLDLDRNRVKARGLMAFLDVISRTPSIPIRITARWKCLSGATRSVLAQLRIDRPLREVLPQLRADPWFPWTEDTAHVWLVTQNGRDLDSDATPFFYALEEGDLLDVSHRELDIVRRGSPASADPPAPSAPGEGHVAALRATVASNHALASLGHETTLAHFVHGRLLREFLWANRGGDPRAATRVKVLRRHVQDGLRVDDFAGLDASLLPRVLAWLGRGPDAAADEERTFLTVPPSSTARLAAIYRLVRGMPELCDV